MPRVTLVRSPLSWCLGISQVQQVMAGAFRLNPEAGEETQIPSPAPLPLRPRTPLPPDLPALATFVTAQVCRSPACLDGVGAGPSKQRHQAPGFPLRAGADARRCQRVSKPGPSAAGGAGISPARCLRSPHCSRRGVLEWNVGFG